MAVAPTTTAAPATSVTGTDQDPALRRLMNQGYTGTVGYGGQLVQMTNGQLPSAQAAAPAPAPPTGDGASWGASTYGNQGTGAGGYTGAGTMPGPGAMGPWSNWMTSGGVNPSGWQTTGGTDSGGWQNMGGTNANNWQQMGGGPDLSFLGQFQQMLQGGANPSSVDPTSAQNIYQSAQPYADQAYQQATRELDPQTQAQNSAFEQQMVNQGIAPGSAAYNQAKQAMSMQQNDAYSQARAQSQTQGLAAQQQGFGQGLANSQLSSQLAQALLGSNTSIANQQLGGNASIMNQLLGGNASVTNQQLGGNSALMNALLNGNSGIAQQLIGGNATMNAAGTAAGASRYNAEMNHDIAQQGLDNGMLQYLMNSGIGQNSYNNNLITQDQNRNQSFMQYMPNGGGGGQIDVQNPYNNQYNGQMAQWQAGNNNANAQNNMYANALGSMAGYFMMCSREYKETLGEIAPVKALDAVRGLPVDYWRYHGDSTIHIGTYAEDFHKAVGLPEAKQISVLDMLGTMLGAVKALDAKMSRIESRLAVAGA